MPEGPGTNELSRGEAISVLTHYYRAEVQRSLAWRDRLDRTTNWAVAAAAAFLGFSFSHPGIPHIFLIFGLAIVYFLLYIEARRYRFYDAYEYRVKVLHQSFIREALENHFTANAPWHQLLIDDLLQPRFKMTRLEAVASRVRANYIYLFLVMIAGWLAKIALHPFPAHNWSAYLRQAAVGPLPGGVVLGFIALFLLHLGWLLYLTRKPLGGRDTLYKPSGRKR